MTQTVTIIGGGLAGCEAAWQLAQRGIDVRLYEMRPGRATPAHHTDRLAELVCSNSMGSLLPDRALGMLKNEMLALGSMVLQVAFKHAVPAGAALAVSREEFAEDVTGAIGSHPRIELVRDEAVAIPEGPAIIATGPLTSDALTAQIQALTGQKHLYFYDAMAPIVQADSIDMSIAFRQSRFDRDASSLGSQGNARGGKNVPPLRFQDGAAASDHPPTHDRERADPPTQGQDALASESAVAEPDGDYINCPMSREEYEAFVAALLAAPKAPMKEFEKELERYFEGCMPVEVLASRGVDSLAFGPMKPIGLTDPRTGRRPHACVQLRQDNVAATLFNMVGFQTNVRWGAQEDVLRMIPGLANAEFVRLGQMHRNTFINSPTLLDPSLQFRTRADLFFAGQITGTEGYVGSTAGGLVAGINIARHLAGEDLLVPPRESMLGALLHYITHAEPKSFQPMKATMGLLPDLPTRVRKKLERYAQFAARGRELFERWARANEFTPAGLPASITTPRVRVEESV